MEDLEIHLQVWKALKSHLVAGDAESAAEDFLHVLIEHGAQAEEIAEYALDADLKLALKEYTDLEDDDEYDDEPDEDMYEYD
jgi:hypothetical protein